jgi:hypothetical protein
MNAVSKVSHIWDITPALEQSTLQGREPLCWATRAMQKVKEAEPTQSTLRGKGKVKVNGNLLEEA